MIPGLTGYAAWVADGVLGKTLLIHIVSPNLMLLARDARIRREARTRDERAPREGAQQDPREVAPRRAHQVSVFEGGREVELPTRYEAVLPDITI